MNKMISALCNKILSQKKKIFIYNSNVKKNISNHFDFIFVGQE